MGGASAFDASSTLATWLQASGVRTGLVGRYLNGYDSLLIPPGWDSWFAFQQNRKSVTLYTDYLVNDHGARRHYGNGATDYSTRVLGRQLRGFLSRQPERPFFALFAPRTPHGPADPDPRDIDLFQGVDLPVLPAYDEADISDKPAWVRENGQLRDSERKRIDKLRRRQFEALAGLDREIAETIEELRASGRLATTWIMFTSDNGVLMGEHRLDAGKACAFEPCIRVPFIVVPPGGLNDGRTETQVVANIDLAPTIAEVMGAPAPADMDGLSLVPLIANPATPWRDDVLLEQWHEDPARRWVGVRTATHKYVRYENGDETLYDLVADPHELDSQARNPAFAEQRAALRDQLDRLLSH